MKFSRRVARLVAAAAVLSSVLVPTAVSASQEVDWFSSTSSTGYQLIEDIAVAADGSSVVVGRFSGTLSLGGLATVTSAVGGTSPDIFVAKLSPAGSWLWVKRFGGSGTDAGYAVDVFDDGSIAFAGSYEVLMNFGGSTAALLSVGTSDIFAGKLSADGTPLWAADSSSPNDEAVSGVAAMDDGSIAITGTFRTMISFGASTKLSAGLDDVFVARTGSNGGWDMAVGAGGSGQDSGTDLVQVSDGGLVVTGDFEGTASFGVHLSTSAGLSDIFVAKLGAGGEWTWVTSGGGDDYDGGVSIGTPGDGTVIMAGNFRGTGVLGGTTLEAAGSRDVAVAKIGPLGAWIWAVRAGGAANESANAIDVWSDGSAVVAGQFNSPDAAFGSTVLSSTTGGPAGEDFFVAKVARYGRWTWALRGGGSYQDVGRGAGARPDCTSLATGLFRDATTFGSYIPDSSPVTRSFVLELSRDAMLCTPLTVGKRGVSAKRIARYAGLDLPAGSYARTTMPKMSSLYCRTNGYKVYSKTSGTCRVKVTVRDRRNKKLSSSVVFLPTR